MRTGKPPGYPRENAQNEFGVRARRSTQSEERGDFGSIAGRSGSVFTRRELRHVTPVSCSGQDAGAAASTCKTRTCTLWPGERKSLIVSIGRQGNFRSMDQPFQTFFEPCKSAVRYQGRHNRRDNPIDRITRLGCFPWIGCQSLQTERNSTALRSNFHHLHFNLLSNFTDLVRDGIHVPRKVRKCE